MKADYCDSCGINLAGGEHVFVEIKGNANFRINLLLCLEDSLKLQKIIKSFRKRWTEPDKVQEYVLSTGGGGSDRDDDSEVGSKSDGVCFTNTYWPR